MIMMVLAIHPSNIIPTPTASGSTLPSAQFFKGSPMLEVLDFLERLAPFSPPELVLRDKTPLLEAGETL